MKPFIKLPVPDHNEKLRIPSDNDESSVGILIQLTGTNWKTDDGLTTGTTIDELLKINGDHIKFRGFGWDYEGSVSNWGNGKLKDKNISVRLEPDHYIRIEDFEGDDAEISSTDSRIKQLGLYVSRFDIIFK